ncbi:SusC/RagA family TonB-linked outer membrane protein [Gillisia sp. CAL575]|uniref:SusC/RagA family TonB-linked outer membrane protein n=1 Tax=Gillisia sp. CAL575 TaxID=985255 RepID=UPI0003AAB7C1|nr:SusC/RagA family TonB-linked outer membrane protein [Gillisia sp. CAL575]
MEKRLLLILLCFIGMQAFAQERMVTGTVIDSNGLPVTGASVYIKDTSNGTVTDIDGKFSLSAPDNTDAVLVISSLGFDPKELSLGDKNTFNVTLVENLEGLDEVVVTALGIKRESKALGYSLTEVGGDDLSQVKTTSAINSLQGRVAGVNISTSSTGASGSSRVIIRGASSLTGNNQPLYVVDGIPIINQTNGSAVGAFGGEHGDGGDDISSINPDDIKTVSILKGSSAAALYGSQASNGVIMITTKSGKGQKGMGVEYSSSFTFDKVNTDLQNFQTEYGQGNNALKPGFEYNDDGSIGEISDPANAIDDSFTSALQSWGAKLDGSQVYNWDGVKRAYSNTGNNLDKFYKTGTTAINTVALSNAGDIYSYRLSFSNLENKDIFPNTNLNRKSFSFNASAKINPRLTSTINTKYILEKVHNRITVGDTPGNANTVAFTLPNSLDIYNLKPGSNEEGTELRFQPSQFISNPYWAVNNFNNDDKKNRFIASTTLKYDITDWLYATGRAGLDTYELTRRQVTPFGTAYRPAGRMTQGKSTYKLFDADLMLGIDKDLTDKISTNSIIGANTRTSSYDALNAVGSLFVVIGLEDINNTTLPEPSYNFYETKTNSLYGSFETAYDEFLFVTFTGRNEWYSTLSFPGKTSPNNDFYWSLSSSFLLNKAFELPKSIDYAKIRASYAQVAGGASNAYALNLDYAVTGSFQGQSFGQINGNSIPNANLVPFQKKEYEIGLDSRFFGNRLSIDLAYYSNQTTNDIVRAAASLSSGYNSSILNIGELQNKGIELLVAGYPIRNENFSWNTSFNLGYNDSKIVYTDDEETAINVDGSLSRSKNAIISHIVGEHYGVIFGSSYKRDDNGNIIYDISGSIPKPVQGENKILGQGVAPYTVGFSNSFNYKNVTLNFLIDGKFGGSVHSGTNRELMMRGLHKKTLEGRETGLEVTGVDNATGETFTMTVAPENLRTYYGFIGEENSGIAEEFVYSTDFIKFRELSLSYNLPKSYLENVFLRDVRFSVIGRNLFFISKKVDNIDPEASLNNLNSQGIERFGIPATRSLGLSFNVKF